MRRNLQDFHDGYSPIASCPALAKFLHDVALQEAKELGVVVDVILAESGDEEVGVVVVLQVAVSLERGAAGKGLGSSTSW